VPKQWIVRPHHVEVDGVGVGKQEQAVAPAQAFQQALRNECVGEKDAAPDIAETRVLEAQAEDSAKLLDELLEDAKPSSKYKSPKHGEELPPGLAQLQQELQLSAAEVESLARINFRGSRPKDAEGWRFLLEAIKMLGQRNSQT